MTKKNLLKILFVEDLPSDVELAVLELRKEKLKFEHTAVCTREDLIKALNEFKPDLIISDYMMPAFNGLQALKVSKEFDPEIPFILCTGSINEETAVECIKAGATDYIIKEHMTRLPFAVKEALEQKIIQNEKGAAVLLLKENEEKLESIFRAAPVGIGLVVNRVFLELNDTFCQMTGYSRKELIGKNSEMIYASNEDYNNVGIEKYRQIADIGTGSVETHFKCKDGRILNIYLSSTPLDKDDLTKGVTFTVMDITERKRIEDELLKRDRQLSSIYDTIGDVLYYLAVEADGRYRFISVNHAFYNVTGLSEEKIVGKLVNEVIPEPSLSIVLGKYRQAIKENSIIRWEEISDYPSGQLTGEVSIAPVVDDKGRCTHLLGTVHDITKRKQAEAELLQSYMFSDSLLKTIPFAMDIVDEEGTVLFQSDNFKGLFGEETIGKKCWELYRDDKTQCSDCPLKRGITIGETETYESHGVLGNRIFEISHTGMMFQGRKAMLEIFQDITNRKKNEEELIRAKEKAEESDRLKTAFLHNISHEIRTPMNAIVGFCTLIGEPDLDSPTQQSYIEVIMQSSNHLLAIITDIIDISNIEANLVKIAENEINLNTTLKSLCNQFIPKAENKKIKLICETGLSDSGALVITDSTKLIQILTNLINNALKFTDKGYIKVRYMVNEKFLEFCVSDTGIGIPQEYHIRIFDRFYQVQYADTRIYEGTGLGLSISKAYVDLMGGKIWLESEPGKGTSFYFSIPYEKSEPAAEVASKIKISKKLELKTKRTILIAEDIESNFHLLEYYLSDSNFEILKAENGKEAVEIALAKKNIDLILMDIKMPVMDGYTATSLIRKANITIPIIAQTAYADDRDRQIECGFNGFISKPFDKKNLLKVLAEFM
jgi:PAS domain S-box-containing protein